MPRIETFKIRVKCPNDPQGLLEEVPGVGFEHRGERFFYRSDFKNSTDVTHAVSGLWVCQVKGKRSIKAAKEALEGVAERHGWDRFLSEIKARSEPCGS